MVKEEWIERARYMIPGYMRYYDVKPGESIDELDIWLGTTDQKYKVCRCTRCGAEFTVDAGCAGMTRDLWTASHNSWVSCPKCMTQVQMKNERLLRSFSSMNWHDRIVFAERVGRFHVILHAYYVEYKFNLRETFPEIKFFEDMRYDLRPGEVKVEKAEPYSNHAVWKEVSIREPWPIVDGMNPGNLRFYHFDADEIFNDTWLQYLPFQKFADTDWTDDKCGYYTYDARANQPPWARIMCYAALYPQIEYAAKLGAWDFLRDLIMHGVKNVRLVNWRAKKPWDFLRMSKQEAEEVIADGCDKSQIELMHYQHLTAAQSKEWLLKGFTHGTVIAAEAELGDTGADIVKYLVKQKYGQNGVHVLIDYRRAAEKLGRDITVPGIRWPRNLTESHDEAVKSVGKISKAQAQENYRKIYKTLREKYEFVTPEYMAIVPPLLSDIKLEGQLQHHCVGGYVDRHASGQCTIIFIRKTLLPLIPLYTVELDKNGNVKQIQGYHNEYKNRPTGKAAEFVEQWKAEIARRLKKSKSKKSTEKKERATA